MGKSWEIIVGDVRRVLRELEPGSFDACLSDLPYGIGMNGAGTKWDYDIPSVNVFVEILRVLKPGAFSMFFGGTRTFHRVVCNLEDAGFLPCDLCLFMYGSGFPKSHDIAKAIDKKRGKWRDRATSVRSENTSMGGPNYGRTDKGRAITAEAKRWEGQGTALKPAWEPISLCCKPYRGTIADVALKHGVGGLAIDASRIGTDERFVGPAGNDGTTAQSLAPTNVTGYTGKTVKGRWPANVTLQHAPGCVRRGTRGKMNGGFIEGRTAGVETVEAYECVDDCPNVMLDQQSGVSKSLSESYVAQRKTFVTGVDIASRAPTTLIQGYGDEGGASRFFYCSKVSRAERDRGLEDFETVAKGADSLRDGSRRGSAKNGHATLKPIDLCRYYARMLLPPPRADGKPRRLLVPYSGAGSEIIGALQAGWDEVVGIELVPKHAEWARARIAKGRIIQNAKK